MMRACATSSALISLHAVRHKTMIVKRARGVVARKNINSKSCINDGCQLACTAKPTNHTHRLHVALG